MTRGPLLLKANSVIFLMILIKAVSTSDSSKSSWRHHGDSASQETGTETKDYGLIRRLVGLKSDKDEVKQILKYRHWYFKPRRKLDDTFPLHRNADDIETYSNNIAKSPHSSPRKLRNRDTMSRGLRRRKRHSGFADLFRPAAVPGESRNMEDLRRAQTKLSKIYHKPTSSLLQITSDGSILGVPDLNKYCVMIVKSVGYENSMTMMKIYGNTTKRYIAMKANGVLYTTTDPNNSDTDFLHKYDANNYDAFLSRKHRRFITMSGANAHAKPAKAKKPSGPDDIAKRAFFLNFPLKKDDLSALASKAKDALDTRTAISEVETTSDTIRRNQEKKPGGDLTKVEQNNLLTTTSSPTNAPASPSSVTTRKSKSNRKKGKRKKKGRRRKGKRRKKARKKGRKRKGRSRKRTKTRTTRSLTESRENIADFESSPHDVT